MKPAHRNLIALALLGTTACTVDDTAEVAEYDGPMNILLVIWDTVRADHLSAYGYERQTTPNLERIVESSTLFEQANPGSYWTTSSIASLLSGMYSHNHGVDFDLVGEDNLLSEEIFTMAEALKERGYHTAMYTNQYLVYSHDDFAQGFDEWNFLAAGDISNYTIALLDDEEKRPWFAVAYWMGAHAPYEPSPEYNLWAEEGHEDINVRGCDGVDPDAYPAGWECFNDLNAGNVTWSEEEWQYIRDLYDAEILEHDALLGRVWEAVEERGMADDTLFAFISDHGESLADHGDINAWHVWPYDDTQLVPLVVRYPGVFPATVQREQVRTMDLYATYMELTGGPADHPMDSESLTEVVDGQSGDRVSVGATAAGSGRQWYRHDGYKIIYSRENEENNVQELFDLVADPMEQTNLWDTMPEKVEELKAAHQAALKESQIAR
jgi:arylsulfatase A-like enzyme